MSRTAIKGLFVAIVTILFVAVLFPSFRYFSMSQAQRAAMPADQLAKLRNRTNYRYDNLANGGARWPGGNANWATANAVGGVASTLHLFSWTLTPQPIVRDPVTAARWSNPALPVFFSNAVSGWAGDRFGTKRTFMFATGLFTVASLLCAAAWSIESLIVFRAMQGIGGGMLTPVGTAMVFRAFPPEERSKASGLMVIPTTVAPASGPVLGGFLIDYISWEWIFLVNVPIGVAGFVVAWRFLREHREPNPGRFDIPGFVLAATGMGTLLYALAEAGTKGWTSTEVVGFGTAGVVLLAGFVAAELRAPQPMIDVRLLKDSLFRACNAAQFVGMTGFSASLFLLPIMLQAQRGLSAFESGLTSFPMALGVMTAAQPVSRAYTRLGPRRLIAAGLVVASLTSFA